MQKQSKFLEFLLRNISAPSRFVELSKKGGWQSDLDEDLARLLSVIPWEQMCPLLWGSETESTD